jgi:hypothetical protein
VQQGNFFYFLPFLLAPPGHDRSRLASPRSALCLCTHTPLYNLIQPLYTLIHPCSTPSCLYTPPYTPCTPLYTLVHPYTPLYIPLSVYTPIHPLYTSCTPLYTPLSVYTPGRKWRNENSIHTCMTKYGRKWGERKFNPHVHDQIWTKMGGTKIQSTRA